jgi:DNA-directed RNA polymerase specialized sigma24 family protein
MLNDFFVNGMSQAEIGAEVGKTEVAIKVDISRTLKKIAQAFGISRNPAKSRAA